LADSRSRRTSHIYRIAILLAGIEPLKKAVTVPKKIKNSALEVILVQREH